MNYRVNTDSARPQPFPPHGRISVEVHGTNNDLIHVKCFGAFNKETMLALVDIQQRYRDLLCPKRYVIVEFIDTCLALPEFFAEATRHHKELVSRGQSSKAVAYVMRKGIEGKSMMKGFYLGVYKDAGIPVVVTETVDEARHWLKEKGLGSAQTNENWSTLAESNRAHAALQAAT